MARRGAIINTVGRDLEKYRSDKIAEVKKSLAFHASSLKLRAQRGLDSAIEPMLKEGVDIRQFNLSHKVTEVGLRHSIGVEGSDDPNSNFRFIAYVEFGTGLSAKSILANYPQWIKDMAYKYWRGGKGELVGQPFLFNNYLITVINVEKDLEKIIKNKTLS